VRGQKKLLSSLKTRNSIKNVQRTLVVTCKRADQSVLT